MSSHEPTGLHPMQQAVTAMATSIQQTLFGDKLLSSSSSSTTPTSVPLRRPRVGFGVYDSPPNLTKASVLTALESGYCHIDTAQYYSNEAEVGEAVRESGIPRHEIWVTTKVLQPSGSVEKTYERAQQSVKEIGLDYIDLFLIHTPKSGPEGRKEMWKALEMLKAKGTKGGTRYIGVSNYAPAHIEEIKNYSTEFPAVNQIELHPWCQQKSTVHYCEKEGILLEAYSPLVRGKYMDNPTLVAMANKHQATPAQVLVRWSLQKGFIPLPKSDRPKRIKENIGVDGFVLQEEEMHLLDAMDQGEKGAEVQWVEALV